MTEIYYENIKVIKKRGYRPFYIYEGTLEAVVTQERGFWFNKVPIEVNREKITFVIYRDDMVNTYCSSCYYVDMDFRFKTDDLQYRKLYRECVHQGQHMKSQDECCTAPDTIKGAEYPLHDIILCYLLGNTKYKVLDYCFNKTEARIGKVWYTDSNTGDIVADELFGFIKFFYKGEEYCYEMNILDKISESACLNCRTCIRKEEDKAIESFKNWLKDEVIIQERAKLAKDICSCEEGL